MARNINLNNAKIIRKNKDYGSIQEAQIFYEKQRLTQLAITLYPVDEVPNGFQENMQYLMRFQNPIQMNVWHNKDVIILENGSDGKRISTTWDNMCNFDRQFTCAEMFQCIEVLKRSTPNELYNVSRAEQYFSGEPDIDESISILRFFNELAYPEIENVTKHIKIVLDGIEEQICKPIRDKINADLKIMLQLPITDTTVFIKGKERRM